MADNYYYGAYTGAQIDAGIAAANAAAPQSTTYNKSETDALLAGKQAALVVGANLDNVPTSGSTNPITSGAVYSALGDINSVLEEVL